MDTRFEDFLTDLDQAKNDDEAWEALCRSAAKLGFDKVIYLYTPIDKFSDREAIQLTTYNEKWMEYWNEQGHADIDIPVRKTMEAGFRPLKFDVGKYIDNPDDHETRQAVMALWEAKNEGGCEHVYSHQLFQDNIGSGAMGFISNSLNSEQFHHISQEQAPLISSIIHISHSRLALGMINKSNERAPKLSSRQTDLISCLAEGLQYKEIAYRMGITENTVAFHMTNLRRKLGCSNSREILSTAYRFGLLHSL